MYIDKLKDNFFSESIEYNYKTYFFKNLSSYDNEIRLNFHLTSFYIEFIYSYEFNFSGDILRITSESRSYKDDIDNSRKQKFLGLFSYTKKFNTNYDIFSDYNKVFKLKETYFDKFNKRPYIYAKVMAEITNTLTNYNYVENKKNEILDVFYNWKENN